MEDVEVDNDGTFATYATPDPEIVQMKAQRRHLEEQSMLKTSENQKLLKDALQDLSGDESPPEIPRKNFTEKVPSRVSGSHIQDRPKKVCLTQRQVTSYVDCHSWLQLFSICCYSTKLF